MIRNFLATAALLGTLGAAHAPQDAPARDDEIVVVGKRIGLARVNFVVAGSSLRICQLASTSGDRDFDKRICVEAKACAAQGFGREAAMNECVANRLAIWERGRAMRPGQGQKPVEAQPTIAPETAILLPGSWEVRRSDAGTARTLCLRTAGRSESILQLLYDNGQEPERSHGNCAKWSFSHQGSGFEAQRRCFQPNYRLDGQMSGRISPAEATVEVVDQIGTTAQDQKEKRATFTARRTGDCAG